MNYGNENEFQFHLGTIKTVTSWPLEVVYGYFNSTLVRLKPAPIMVIGL